MLHSIINGLSFVITVALYVIFCTGQYCSMGQLSFYLQLQDFCWWVDVLFKIFKLWSWMRFFRLIMQILLSLMVLFLKGLAEFGMLLGGAVEKL